MKKMIIALTALILVMSGCSQKKEDVTAKQAGSKIAEIEDKKSKDSDKKDDTKKEDDSKKDTEGDVKETTSSSKTTGKNETAKSSQTTKDVSTSKPKKETSNQSNATSTTPSAPPKKEEPTPPVEEKTPVKQTAMANDVMAKINAYRQQNGLQPLQSTSDYQEEADAHALEMAQARALWHGDNGECITNHPDPFNAWINSPEHKAIILTPNNTQGVVSIYFVDGYYYSVFRTSW
ncbi:MAG: CAP domain-containing protein [Beduini sp.]|uniref:CAP domain-containing protein n=1 Tax=Beduini sp. TaxID=1922300 RepID=UPI0039906BC0